MAEEQGKVRVIDLANDQQRILSFLAKQAEAGSLTGGLARIRSRKRERAFED